MVTAKYKPKPRHCHQDGLRADVQQHLSSPRRPRRKAWAIGITFENAVQQCTLDHSRSGCYECFDQILKIEG